MPSLKDIRKRISSVKNTQKITRALKLVSAAKLNRAQREMSRLRPYAEKQTALIRDLVAEVGSESSPLFEPRNEVKRVAVLLITSDRGMCGGFNSNVLKLFRRFELLCRWLLLLDDWRCCKRSIQLPHPLCLLLFTCHLTFHLLLLR